jgi:hypothetical protein
MFIPPFLAEFGRVTYADDRRHACTSRVAAISGLSGFALSEKSNNEKQVFVCVFQSSSFPVITAEKVAPVTSFFIGLRLPKISRPIEKSLLKRVKELLVKRGAPVWPD